MAKGEYGLFLNNDTTVTSGYQQLPILRKALQEHMRRAKAGNAIETIMKAA